MNSRKKPIRYRSYIGCYVHVVRKKFGVVVSDFRGILMEASGCYLYLLLSNGQTVAAIKPCYTKGGYFDMEDDTI